MINHSNPRGNEADVGEKVFYKNVCSFRPEGALLALSAMTDNYYYGFIS